MGMDKYAVEVDDTKTKTAGDKKFCPACGAEAATNSNVPICPNCGTKPFEKEAP